MNQKTIEGSGPGRYGETIGPNDCGIDVAECLEPRLRLRGETPISLDGQDLQCESRQDRRRIAGTGADLENAAVGFQRQKTFHHPGHQEGLGHGLSAWNRQRDIPRGKIGIAMGGEKLARHGFERTQNRQITNALGAQPQQKFGFGFGAGAHHGGGHGGSIASPSSSKGTGETLTGRCIRQIEAQGRDGDLVMLQRLEIGIGAGSKVCRVQN